MLVLESHWGPLLVALRFYKGFANLRERTSCFRHFYLARKAQIRT